MIRTINKATLTQRDYDILIFLWRWKYISTRAIWNKFFPGAKLKTCYGRLYQLKKAKYIAIEPVRWNEGNAWKLTRKGYGAIINDLPPVEKFGYGGEFPRHDFLVSAIHLGDWLVDRPENLGLFSEQQIRRVDRESYPSWIPQSDLHNSDGYWGFDTEQGTKLISLEVEISWKVPSKYEKTRKFYRRYDNIEFCVWVVPTLKLAKRIFEAHAETPKAEHSIHQFILGDDAIEFNWDSEIKLGSWKGKKLRDLLLKHAQNSPHDLSQ